VFFVNVASKGFSVTVSHLESTLAGVCVNIDSKEFKLECGCCPRHKIKQK